MVVFARVEIGLPGNRSAVAFKRRDNASAAHVQPRYAMLQRQLLLLVQLLCVAALPLSAWRTKSIYQLLTDRFAAVPTPPQCGNYGSYCGGTFAGIVAHLGKVPQDYKLTRIVPAC